jgi:hypothetical protein
VESQWDDHPSSPDHVYLTVAYAAYFAMQATPDGERWAIIEIDTDLLPDDGTGHLYPDEDWLEQATRGQMLPAEWDIPLMTADPATGTMTARTSWFRENLWMFPHMWEDSINGLGNCAYGGVIPPEAITRVSFIEPARNPSMTLMASDPTITLLNYAFCQSKYQNLIKWCMGDEVDTSAFVGCPAGVVFPERMRQMFQQQEQQLRQILSNRTGVTVRSCQ